jgi:ethanolamine phosphate transferase 2 subunit G
MLLRAARRWNQTGQKHAGAPDIVHSSFLTQSWSLWFLVATTYISLSISLIFDFNGQRSRQIKEKMSNERSLFGISLAMAIGGLAFLFKLSFAARDAPELVVGLPRGKELVEWLEDVPLVGLARLVFAFLAVASGTVVVLRERGHKGEGIDGRRKLNESET